MEQLNKFWQIDWSRLYPETIKGLKEGTVRVVDGVAYWKKGAEEGAGIIQHLPFEKADQEVIEAVKNGLPISGGGTGAVAVPIMISTACIVGAVIISTAYLAEKLNKLQATADQILLAIKNQNFVYYLEKITRYVGLMETAREYLVDRDSAPSLVRLMENLVVELSTTRNETISFVDNLLNFSLNGELKVREKELILDFIDMMLNLLPKGIHLEHLLHARMGNLEYSEIQLELARKSYYKGLSSYKSWCQIELKELYKGNRHDSIALIERAEECFLMLESNEQNFALLNYLSEDELELMRDKT